MNGPQHYAAAERLLALAEEAPQRVVLGFDAAQSDEQELVVVHAPIGHAPTLTMTDVARRDHLLDAAQVHATLALVAATAYPAVRDWCADEGSDSREWAKATAPEQPPAASGGHVTNGVSF